MAVEMVVTTPEPESALASVLAGESDLAVVHSYSNIPRTLPDGVESEPLLTEPIWVAVRPDDPVAALEIDLADLADHPWITPQQDLTCFEMTDRACGLAGFRPRVVAQTMDFAAQLQFVAAGAGVALVPDTTGASVPPGVRLARPSHPLERHSTAVRRSSLHGDKGLDKIGETFRSKAEKRVR